jgi:Ca-activated chloride channel family protein
VQNRELAAIGVAVGCLLAAWTSAGARQTPVFKAGVDLVNIGVTVTDRKGGLVGDLRAQDFEIYEDGVRQTIRFFAAGATEEGEKPPMHLGLLLDVSESMGDDIAFTKTAAIKFLNTLTDAEDVTMVDFDTEVRSARYTQGEFARLVERIRQRRVKGSTALYDAIGVYLNSAESQNGRKVMLLYTDGGDTRSAIRFGELTDLLKASDVTIYVVGALEHQLGSARLEQRGILRQIADLTGGQAYFPSSTKELDEVYGQVVAEIRAQYTIGYVSLNMAADGSWRKLEVRLDAKEGPPGRRDYRLRARHGYFAPYRKP